MKLRTALAAAVAAIASAPLPSPAEDPTIDRLLAAQCAQCHGTDGYAVGDMDGLAGDQDLLADLLDMVGEDHIEDIMEHQAHGYTPEQMRRIAAYYADLPESAEHGQGEDRDKDRDERRSTR